MKKKSWIEKNCQQKSVKTFTFELRFNYCAYIVHFLFLGGNKFFKDLYVAIATFKYVLHFRAAGVSN